MLNFGQIKEHFEDEAGENISASKLARYINSAQIEIAKRYGKRVSYWFPTSIVKTTAPLSQTDNEVPVESAICVPAPPNYVCLGYGGAAEIIYYSNISGDTLIGVKRGQNGTAPNVWPEGTDVSMLAEAGIEMDLPSNVLELHEVRDTNLMPTFAYQVTEDNKITFFQDGFYRIIYTRSPVPIDWKDVSSMPEVHEAFHNDIIQYCIARHWQELAEGIQGEEQKALTLLTIFERSINATARLLRRNANQQYTIAIELWD